MKTRFFGLASFAFAIALGLVLCHCALALTVATPFTDHMVLQRDQPVPVWGTAEAGAEVTVAIDDEGVSTKADEAGNWRVNVGPLEAGGPVEVTVSCGDESLTLSDVLVGEVWVASGQSNMQWELRNTYSGQAAVAEADWPQIRLLSVDRTSLGEPADSFKTEGWQVCTPASAERFSAVAYFFGREVHQKVGVPVGLIHSSWGGSAMEAWVSREEILTRPHLKEQLRVADEHVAKGEEQHPHRHPTRLFNGMIAPLIPYGMRGVIWYQGETNAPRYGEYLELSKMMIADWRARWGQGDFPFYFVQLAAWQPGEEYWPYLRETQLQTLAVPNTAMAVATDIGNTKDIHPRDKVNVGHRLALPARALVYGEKIEYSGPIYRDVQFDGGKAIVSFDHAEGGLQAVMGKLKSFVVCGEDKKFVPAEAVIVGETVQVWSDEVASPIAVRYNWEGYTEGNLYNAAGLPASPFRTDSF